MTLQRHLVQLLEFQHAGINPPHGIPPLQLLPRAGQGPPHTKSHSRSEEAKCQSLPGVLPLAFRGYAAGYSGVMELAAPRGVLMGWC